MTQASSMRGVCVWLALSLSGWQLLNGQTQASAHVEYIRFGDRLLATISAPAAVFTDSAFSTPPYSGFADAAHVMYGTGITLGCQTSPPLFCADSALQRKQMAVFIIRAWSLRVLGSTEAFKTNPQTVPSSTPYFADVANDTYFPYIQKMYELGITSGCTSSPRNFCPDQNATNYMIAVFSVRGRAAAEKPCLGADFSCAQSLPASYMNYPDSPSFLDVTYDRTVGSVYQFVQQAVMFGAISPSVLVPGCPSGTGYVCVNSDAMRGQMAAHVVRIVLGDRSF